VGNNRSPSIVGDSLEEGRKDVQRLVMIYKMAKKNVAIAIKKKQT
jgi:hypothetical protein